MLRLTQAETVERFGDGLEEVHGIEVNGACAECGAPWLDGKCSGLIYPMEDGL